MNKTLRLALTLVISSPIFFAGYSMAKDAMQINVSLPTLNVNPYHKPFVAVWLESKDRKYITTIALWANDKEWYKDLRQWWRKAGRSKQPFDAVTGATKKPGEYIIRWTGKDAYGNHIPAGEYQLKIEASREEGGREFLKTKISIDQQGHITSDINGQWGGKTELGSIKVLALN